MLAEVARRALAEEPVSELLETCAVCIPPTLEMPVLAVVRLRDGSRWRHFWSAGVQGNRRMRTSITISAKQLTRYTLRARGAVLVPDFRTDNRFEARGLWQEHGVLTAVAAPIRGHWDALGSIEIYGRSSDGLSEAEGRFLQLLGGILGARIDRRDAEAAEEQRRSMLQHAGEGGARQLDVTGPDPGGARKSSAALARALHDSERRYRMLLNAMDEGVAILDPQDDIRYANRAFCGITGYSPNEVVGRPMRYFLGLSDRRLLESSAEHPATSQGPWHESSWVRKDGRTVEVLVSMGCMRGVRRKAESRFCLVVDISERKRAVALHERLAAVLDATPDFVSFADPSEQVLYINPGGRRMLGLDEESDASRRIGDLAPPWAYRKVRKQGIPGALRNGAWEGETALLAADGRSIPVSQLILAHKTPTGQLEVLSTIARDISRQKSLQEEMELSHERLQELSDSLLSAQEQERKRISRELHDSLGQMLTGIKYGAEYALERLAAHDPEAAHASLQPLVSQVRTAVGELRRIAMNLRPSMLDDLGVIAALSWLCRETRKCSKLNAIDLIPDLEEESIPPALKAPLFRIAQEALNNAVKHSHANRVRIRLGTDGDEIVLTLEDDGRGYDQSSQASSDAHCCLGLASMRERAHMSGGALSIVSAPGSGTRVEARWPSPAR
jgi:PAS domain S-box-containing protein